LLNSIFILINWGWASRKSSLFFLELRGEKPAGEHDFKKGKKLLTMNENIRLKNIIFVGWIEEIRSKSNLMGIQIIRRGTVNNNFWVSIFYALSLFGSDYAYCQNSMTIFGFKLQGDPSNLLERKDHCESQKGRPKISRKMFLKVLRMVSAWENRREIQQISTKAFSIKKRLKQFLSEFCLIWEYFPPVLKVLLNDPPLDDQLDKKGFCISLGCFKEMEVLKRKIFVYQYGWRIQITIKTCFFVFLRNFSH